MGQMTMKEVFSQILWVLNYQIFELDGNPISVGKILTGIFLLVVGYLFSRRASKELDRRVLSHMPVDESIRHTLTQLIFYFFLFVSTLFTLRGLNVPITIFTVIGGALAVGIGFGSQNLVNNFISGVLVMAERPMRIGDLVEVDGVVGSVESIGIRSTRIRSLRNVVMTLPNTVFIEKNLTNWTMSGKVACAVNIGVSYGSDVNMFSSLAADTVREVQGVLADEVVTVSFMDFGDNALIFELGFMIAASTFPNRKAIESQIRFRLYEVLNEAGIGIPFPQRDVHLTVSNPVPVKVLN